MVSVLGLGRFSTLIGTGTAVTVTIGGGYLIVKKAKKASTDTSHAPVSQEETVDFSSYEVGELKLDEKIQYFSKIMDGMIKLDEKRIRIPAGTGLNTLGDLNLDVVENIKNTNEESSPSLDDVIKASEENGDIAGEGAQQSENGAVEGDSQGDDDSANGDDVSPDTGTDQKASSDTDENLPNGSEQKTDSSKGDEGQTQQENVPSSNEGEKSKEAKTVDTKDTAGGGDDDTSKTKTQQGINQDNLDTQNQTGSQGGTSNGSGSGSQQKEDLAIDNLITQLETKMKSDSDLEIIKQNKELISKWIKSFVQTQQNV